MTRTALFVALLLAAAVARAQMVFVPAGDFWMGSPNSAGNDDEHPRHKVRLSAYSIDAREVGLADFVAYLNSLPPDEKPEALIREQSYWIRTTAEGFKPAPQARPDEPAIEMLWEGAVRYCASLGKRLPTEAEWEKACLAGSTSAYSFGDDPARLDDYAWYKKNSRGHTPIGAKRPNAWGLYDMNGGVWEMTSDWYAPDFYARSPRENPQSAFSTGGQAARTLRGGSRLDDAAGVRCAVRRPLHDAGLMNAGFRCAKSEPAEQR